MIRNIVFAAAMVAAFAPAISNASTERVSLKACASAFATSIALPGTTPAYKVAYRGGVGSAITDYYATDYVFVLEAHDPKSGLATARARCSTNSRGAVTGIAAMPLDMKPATLAAQF